MVSFCVVSVASDTNGSLGIAIVVAVIPSIRTVIDGIEATDPALGVGVGV